MLAIAGPVVQTANIFMGNNKVLRGNLPLRRCDTSNNNVTCHRQRSALKKTRKLSLPQTNSDKTSSSQIAQPCVMVAQSQVTKLAHWQNALWLFHLKDNFICGQCSSEDFACLWVEGPQGQGKQILRENARSNVWVFLISHLRRQARLYTRTHHKPMKSKKRNSRNDWTNIFSESQRWRLDTTLLELYLRKNDVNDAGQMRSNPTVNYEVSLNMFYESSQGWQQQDRTNFEDPTSYSLTIKFGKLRKHRGTPPSFEKRSGWKTQAKIGVEVCVIATWKY